MSRLKKYMTHKEIKFLVGLRGVGKTSLLNLFVQELLNSGVNEQNIIRLDLDTIFFSDVYDGDIFYEFITSQIQSDGETFLLLDEIKKITNWQTVLSKLKENFNLNIYISSSTNISEEDLFNFFDESPIFLKILPLSFKEFLNFHEFPFGITLEEQFSFYLIYGGMPTIIDSFFNDSITHSTLLGNFSASLVRDILSDNKVKDFNLMTNLIQKIYESSATVQSFNNFRKMFLDKLPAIRTVENYTEKILQSHLIYSEPVTDIKKDTLYRYAKYYPVDFGFKNLLLGESELNEQILETLVYLEFLRLNVNISILRVDGQTIFQIERGDLKEKFYIGIIKNFSDTTKNFLDYVPFKSLKNMFSKWIITADEINTISEEGIKITNILDFLLSE